MNQTFPDAAAAGSVGLTASRFELASSYSIQTIVTTFTQSLIGWVLLKGQTR